MAADADRAAEREVVRYQDLLDSLRTDEQIKGFATRYFSLFDFHVIERGQHHFQSLTMRRPG